MARKPIPPERDRNGHLSKQYLAPNGFLLFEKDAILQDPRLNICHYGSRKIPNIASFSERTLDSLPNARGFESSINLPSLNFIGQYGFYRLLLENSIKTAEDNDNIVSVVRPPTEEDMDYIDLMLQMLKGDSKDVHTSHKGIYYVIPSRDSGKIIKDDAIDGVTDLPNGYKTHDHEVLNTKAMFFLEYGLNEVTGNEVIPRVEGIISHEAGDIRILLDKTGLSIAFPFETGSVRVDFNWILRVNENPPLPGFVNNHVGLLPADIYVDDFSKTEFDWKKPLLSILGGTKMRRFLGNRSGSNWPNEKDVTVLREVVSGFGIENWLFRMPKMDEIFQNDNISIASLNFLLNGLTSKLTPDSIYAIIDLANMIMSKVSYK